MNSKKLFLPVMSLLVFLPSALAAPNNAFSGALQIILDIFSLKWAMGANLEPATRMLFWLALFAAMHAILKMLSDSSLGMKWLGGRTAGILSFCLATISAIFISPTAVLSVGANWGAVGLLVLMIPVVIGVGYLTFTKSKLSKWLRLLGVVLLIFFIDWMVIVLSTNPISPIHSFFEDVAPWIVLGLTIYALYLFVSALIDALGGAAHNANTPPPANPPTNPPVTPPVTPPGGAGGRAEFEEFVQQFENYFIEVRQLEDMINIEVEPTLTAAVAAGVTLANRKAQANAVKGLLAANTPTTGHLLAAINALTSMNALSNRAFRNTTRRGNVHGAILSMRQQINGLGTNITQAINYLTNATRNTATAAIATANIARAGIECDNTAGHARHRLNQISNAVTAIHQAVNAGP